MSTYGSASYGSASYGGRVQPPLLCPDSAQGTYGSASYGCFTYGGRDQPPASDVRSGRGGASYLRGLHYRQARTPTDEQRRRRLQAEQLILFKA